MHGMQKFMIVAHTCSPGELRTVKDFSVVVLVVSVDLEVIGSQEVIESQEVIDAG